MSIFSIENNYSNITRSETYLRLNGWKFMKLNKGQYYGEIVQRLDVNGITLTKSSYNATEKLPTHFHPDPYFCYVLKGKYLERAGQIELSCNTGDIIFHSAATEHANKFLDQSSLCFNIEVNSSWMEKFLEENFNLFIIKSKDKHLETLFLKILHEMHYRDNLSNLMIESLLVEAFVTLKRNVEVKPVPKYLKRVVDFLQAEYQNNPTLHQIAQVSGTTPEHMIREFKRKFNMTIGDYLRQLKIKRACELLKDSTKEIVEITYELGFSDQSHFTKVFKKAMGFTPLSYRNCN